MRGLGLGTLSVAVLTLVASVLVVGVAPPAQAVTFTVTKTADTNDGVCDADCSLREAIVAANTLPGADVISVPAGTYALTIAGGAEEMAATGDLDIRDAVTINGAGAAATIIDAAALGDRVIDILLVDAVITGVTIRGGTVASNGAGIAVRGGLDLRDSVVTENTNTALGNGAGISVSTDRTATITRSRITQNRANVAGSQGGGISNFNGKVSITDSVVSNNEAAAAGGGVSTFGSISPTSTTITRTTITGNKTTAAPSNGGGIRNESVGGVAATMSINSSTITGNTTVEDGGGISNDDGTVTIDDSTVSGNRANGDDGGGIWTDAGMVTVTDSTFSGNFADDDGGGVRTLGASTVVLDRVTISGNTANDDGGGVNQLTGAMTMTNVTVSGNTAGDNAGGINASGAGSLFLAHTTITNNTATDEGGGMRITQNPRVIAQSILQGNAAAIGADCAAAAGGSLASSGGNIVGAAVPVDCGFVAGGSDQVGVDPKLGPLQDNGSPHTHALLPSSPALDALTPPCAVATDARKVSRPQGAGCDIGAYEAGPAHDVGLVDTTVGQWHLRDVDTGAVTSFSYGDPGDVPFMGDWDCDGTDTPGLYRQSDGFAYLRNSNTTGIADISFFFGDPGDLPVAGDFNNDGCDTLSIYRSQEQRFYVINALGMDGGGLGAADFSFDFGNPGDAPVTGDWDGDGVTEVGLFRESAGFFYFRNSLSTGIADDEFFFGDPDDRFVGGDWGVIDGADSPAVFRGSAATFFFKHTLITGPADSQILFGQNGWRPVSGIFGL